MVSVVQTLRGVRVVIVGIHSSSKCPYGDLLASRIPTEQALPLSLVFQTLKTPHLQQALGVLWASGLYRHLRKALLTPMFHPFSTALPRSLRAAFSRHTDIQGLAKGF